MWDRARELASDWLMVLGGVLLLGSLFLTWTHQFPPGLPSVPGLNIALTGVPRDASGWQVYSVVDVLLAVLAAALVVVALVGRRSARITVGVAAAIALVFVIHAMNVPPTNGLDVVNPAAPARGYIGGRYATAGAGETVALAGLVAAIVGAVLGALSRRG